MRHTVSPPLDPARYRHVERVRVRFAETDAMGIAHHASYLPWLEAARVGLLRAAGHPYAEIRAAGTDLAVVECHVRYRTPARFDDELAIHCAVAPPTRATFEIAYLVLRGAEPVATAVTVHACLEASSGRPLRPPPFVGELATPGLLD